MRTGKWGLLSSVVLGGLGLVFTGLGLFDSHATEALPFGVVMLVVGVVLGLPSLRAVSATLREEDVAAPSLDAPSELAPPVAMKCPSCAAPVPLRLTSPRAVTCGHCGATTPLSPAMTQALTRAAELAKQREASEQKLTEVLQRLPQKHAHLRSRLTLVQGVLVAVSAASVLFGWATRLRDETWHGYLAFGLLALPVAVVVAAVFKRWVPRLTKRVVGHWAALQLPGVDGLGCRVCGAPLPKRPAAVLSCEFCAADNLAGPEVHALVAHDAAWLTRGALAVGRRSAKADELAAFAVFSFPVVTLVAWFAIGAFAGGVGLRAIGWIELEPWPSLPLALVKRAEGACVAWVEPRGEQVELRFGGDDTRTVARAEFEREAIEQHLRPATLVGKSLNGKKVEKVGIELHRPWRVEASTSSGTLYLPAWDLGGELLCVTH